MNPSTIYTFDTYPFYIGKYMTRNHEIPLHYHEGYEIFIATTDNIIYHVEGQVYDLKIGDIIITNSTEIHRPITTNNQVFGRKFMLFNPASFSTFSQSCLSVLSIFTNRKKGYSCHLRPKQEDKEEIDTIFEKMQCAFSKENDESNLLCSALAIELFVILNNIYDYCYKDKSAKEKINTLNPKVQSVLTDLNHNYIKAFTLDDLAKRNYMEKFYMCHLFKKEMGISIMEYTQIKKIMHSKALIKEGTLTLVKVASLSGFSDYSNFYKTFRKIMNLSPKEYQKRINESNEENTNVMPVDLYNL